MASTSQSGGGSAGSGGGGNGGGGDKVGDNSHAEKLAHLADLQNCYNKVVDQLALYEPLIPHAEHGEVTQTPTTPSLQAVCSLLRSLKDHIQLLMEEEEKKTDSS